MLSLIGLLWTIVQLNPYQNQAVSLLIFYCFVFLLVFSVSIQLGFWVRHRFGLRELVAQHFKTSARQGLFFGVLTTALLLLQAYRLTGWVNSLLLTGTITCLEFYFLTKERSTSS